MREAGSWNRLEEVSSGVSGAQLFTDQLRHNTET